MKDGLRFEYSDGSVDGATIVDSSNQYYDIKFHRELKPGDIIHVLYMKYTTGDSFGSYPGNTEILMVYENIHVAFFNRARAKHFSGAGSLNLFNDWYDFFWISNPGYGYFEHVDAIVISSIQLE